MGEKIDSSQLTSGHWERELSTDPSFGRQPTLSRDQMDMGGQENCSSLRSLSYYTRVVLNGAQCDRTYCKGPFSTELTNTPLTSGFSNTDSLPGQMTLHWTQVLICSRSDWQGWKRDTRVNTLIWQDSELRERLSFSVLFWLGIWLTGENTERWTPPLPKRKEVNHLFNPNYRTSVYTH